MADSSPTASTENTLNALDTRDVTLPRRLWSWLAKQAKQENCSVDEVMVDLIDAYRHPEQGDTTEDLDLESASETSGGADTERDHAKQTTADRLRAMSRRLRDLRDNKDNASDIQEMSSVEVAEALLQSSIERKSSASNAGAEHADEDQPSAENDTEILINQAMRALSQDPESSSISGEEDREGEGDGGPSMFDVVRENGA